MNSQNDILRDKCNLTAWHKAGLNGSLSIIGIGEIFDTDKWGDLGGRVTAPFKGQYFSMTDNDDFHAFKSTSVIPEFAPGSKLVQLPFLDIQKFKELSIPYILENKIGSMFISIATGENGTQFDTAQGEHFDDLLKLVPGFIPIAGAGNYGYSKLPNAREIYAVGAVDVNFKLEAYTAASDYIDYAFFTNIYVYNPGTQKCIIFNGCSATAPAIVALLACVDDLFIIKRGYGLSRKMKNQFLVDCAKDIYAPGYDNYTGYGFPILPNPEDVDINKYMEEKEMIYVTFADVPEWAKPTITKLISDGSLKGDEKGNLNVSMDFIRIFTILDRKGLLK